MLLRAKCLLLLALALAAVLMTGCQPAAATPATAGQAAGVPRVLAAESFLADIAQNVAGDRLKVDTLLPLGADPHSFEPAPNDAARVAQSSVLIVNGAGMELFLDKLMQNAGGKRLVITASAGLPSRTAREGETAPDAATAGTERADPHFWLDPTKVVPYVENIRDGLSQADPAGAGTYAANAGAYIKKLGDLDAAIVALVQQIPADRRLLVTNHEALGYFADHYGFRIVGTVIPSVSTEAAPSARELAHLIDQVKAAHAPAIFLEVGTNPQLAQQVAQETGARVVTDLYTESLTGPNGLAPTYVAMMQHDVQTIVSALK